MKLVFRTKIVALENISEEEVEFENEKTEYRSERRILSRNFSAEEVIQFILEKFNIQRAKLHVRYCRKYIQPKAMLVFLLRNLCNMRCSDICSILGNITEARVSSLSVLGIKFLDRDERYCNIVNEFLSYCL